MADKKMNEISDGDTCARYWDWIQMVTPYKKN